MSPQPDICAGCGAEVHPEDIRCPACGAPTARRRWLPALVGVLGVMVALAAGMGVWVLLAPKPGAPPAPAVAQADAGAPASMDKPAGASATPQAQAPQASSASVFAPPSDASLVPPMASQVPSLPTPSSSGTSVLPGPTDVGEALPPPTIRPGIATIPSDPAARRDFAKTTQESFTQNGLDMVVTASGPDLTVITLKFSFPAKTAVELIVSGPFPRQCKARGFLKVQFSDSTGASWTYDLETDKLSQK